MTTSEEPATPKVSGRERERIALETPLLNRIVNQLDGRLLKIEEGFGEELPAEPPVEEVLVSEE